MAKLKKYPNIEIYVHRNPFVFCFRRAVSRGVCFLCGGGDGGGGGLLRRSLSSCKPAGDAGKGGEGRGGEGRVGSNPCFIVVVLVVVWGIILGIRVKGDLFFNCFCFKTCEDCLM